MNDYGLVSIITASYNSRKYISETIDAIIGQTYSNWELLITDDCSTDGSTSVIKRYADKDCRIKLMHLDSNQGTGVSRNNSIRAAKGRFIAFCDSDDRWTPDKLECQLKFMTENNYKLTYTSYFTCNESGKINGHVKCRPDIGYRQILKDNGIGCLTAIYDTNLIGKQYMSEIRRRQDWCLWINIISKFGKAHGLQKPLAIYRERSGSISANKLQMLKWNYNVYRKELGFNAIASALILGLYFMPYYIYKKIKQKHDYIKEPPKGQQTIKL